MDREKVAKENRYFLKELTQVTMQLEEVPFGTLQRFEYKARRWTDERIEDLERVKYLEK